MKCQMSAVTCKEASFRFCINSLETMSRTALPCILKPHQASQASPERLNFYRTSPQAPQGSLRHPPSIHQTFPKPPNRPRVSLEHSRAFPKSLMPPSFPKAFTWTLFVRPCCFPWRLLVRFFFLFGDNDDGDYVGVGPLSFSKSSALGCLYAPSIIA